MIGMEERRKNKNRKYQKAMMSTIAQFAISGKTNSHSIAMNVMCVYKIMIITVYSLANV